MTSVYSSLIQKKLGLTVHIYNRLVVRLKMGKAVQFFLMIDLRGLLGSCKVWLRASHTDVVDAHKSSCGNLVWIYFSNFHHKYFFYWFAFIDDKAVCPTGIAT